MLLVCDVNVKRKFNEMNSLFGIYNFTNHYTYTYNISDMKI